MTQNEELQLELDVKKWIESERAGKDLCGSYSYCEFCDKELKNPCAEAYLLAMEEDASEEPLQEVTETIVHEDGSVEVRVKYRQLSFQEKLEKAKDETKEKYAKLKEMVESFGFSAKMLRRYVIVRYHGIFAGKITLIRNSLKFHMALNPDSYVRYTHMNYDHFKCYKMCPFTMKYDTKKSFTNTEILLPKLAKKCEKQMNK